MLVNHSHYVQVKRLLFNSNIHDQNQCLLACVVQAGASSCLFFLFVHATWYGGSNSSSVANLIEKTSPPNFVTVFSANLTTTTCS